MIVYVREDESGRQRGRDIECVSERGSKENHYKHPGNGRLFASHAHQKSVGAGCVCRMAA